MPLSQAQTKVRKISGVICKTRHKSLTIGGIPTIHGQKLSTNYMFVIHNPVISTRDTVDNLSKPE